MARWVRRRKDEGRTEEAGRAELDDDTLRARRPVRQRAEGGDEPDPGAAHGAAEAPRGLLGERERDRI